MYAPDPPTRPPTDVAFSRTPAFPHGRDHENDRAEPFSRPPRIEENHDRGDRNSPLSPARDPWPDAPTTNAAPDTRLPPAAHRHAPPSHRSPPPRAGVPCSPLAAAPGNQPGDRPAVTPEGGKKKTRLQPVRRRGETGLPLQYTATPPSTTPTTHRRSRRRS